MNSFLTRFAPILEVYQANSSIFDGIGISQEMLGNCYRLKHAKSGADIWSCVASLCN